MRRPLSLLALAVSLALAGCATSNPDVISRHDTQRMATVLDATVVAVRQVTVDGSQNGAGGVAGGVVGAVAGSSIGGRRDSIVGGVLGAVAGAVVGNAIERSATREDAQEILVQLRNGERRAIVQARGSESFQPGDAVVIVTNGGKARVSRSFGAAPAADSGSAQRPLPAPLPTPLPGTRGG